MATLASSVSSTAPDTGPPSVLFRNCINQAVAWASAKLLHRLSFYCCHFSGILVVLEAERLEISLMFLQVISFDLVFNFL